MRWRMVIRIFILLSFFSYTTNARESELLDLDIETVVKDGKKVFEKKNLNFMEQSTTAIFYEKNVLPPYDCSSPCEDLVGILSLKNEEKIFLSTYKHDAGVPFIGSIMTYDINQDQKNELVVMLKRKQVVRAENINSIFYKIYIYSSVTENRNGVKKVMLLENIMEEFGEGDDGVFHGEEVFYPYKTTHSIQKKLEKIKNILTLSNSNFFNTIVIKSYQKSFRLYKKKKFEQSVSSLDRTFRLRKIETEYPKNYQKRYIPILNDYAFFIFKHYESRSKSFCKYTKSTSKKEALEFRFKTLQKAKKVLEYVLELSPNRVVAYLNLADVLYDLDLEKEAEEMYQKYNQMMSQQGKQKRIPKRAKEKSARKKKYSCKK